MGRPKGSKNLTPGQRLARAEAAKNDPSPNIPDTKKSGGKRYRSTRQLFIPKDPLRYRAAKLQTMIRRFDKIADDDPSKVDIAKYSKLLQEFEEVSEQISKNRQARRLDKKRLDSPSRPRDTEAVGQDEHSELGTGVSAEDQGARQGINPLSA